MTQRYSVVAGPLAHVEDDFRTELQRLGYGSRSDYRQVRLLAHLSLWIGEKRISPGELTSGLITEFLAERRRLGWRLITVAGVRPLLTYLRQSGIIPEERREVQDGPMGALLERYHDYLRSERGLNMATIANYERASGRFISAMAATKETDLASLTVADITRFVIRVSNENGLGSPRDVMPQLRAFLRFLHIEGVIGAPLAQSVPSYRSWRGGQLPKWLPSEDINRLLNSCDTHTALGRRDHAILVLLIRLGLRAGEVAAMTLDDIDWRAGEIVVHGKGPRMDRLPLPADVGEALAAYIREGRSAVADRRVFLSTKAPVGGLHRGTVTAVVSRAADHAGLPSVGPHRLRHSAATAMLRSGASLPEIAQVLRHRHVDTTAIYAKVDHAALSLVARPWPGTLS